MTRKNYNVIAVGILNTKIRAMAGAGLGDENTVELARLDTIKLVAQFIAVELKWDNPRFDEVRFMKACGF